MNNVVENMEQECKKCRHSKSDHYRPILDYANNPKAIVSICKKEDCDCMEFIPMSVWINQPKHNNTKWKNEEKH